MSAGARNPIRLVAPGQRGELELARGVTAHVIRGTRPGPMVWAWAPRGESDPSMAQALGELRDRLSPASLTGALGLLLNGPPPPLGREQYPWAGAVRAISDGAAAVVLLFGLPSCEAAPHVAVELDDKPSRRIARALGASYITPAADGKRRLNRAVLAAPTVEWIDGEPERLSRAVVDRADRALRSLLATLGMIAEEPIAPTVRVVLKSVVWIDADGAGVVEPAVAPGELVRAGEVAAYLGEPGLRTRHPLRAPTSGVVLYAKSGRVAAGPVMGIGRLHRALPAVVRAAARPSPRERPLDIGWCERVALPELGVQQLKAKIDTGARTSALHVTARRPAGTDGEGRPLYDIEIPVGPAGSVVTARVTVVDWTLVRDSGGHADRRPVIETGLALGAVERRVRVSLTDRGDMLFPMLVGRTALGPEVRIHPARRFLLRARRP